jgi:hypothetical protein
MTEKKPIPLRASRKQPEPIVLPKPSPLDHHLTLRDLSKILFTIGHYDESEPTVVEMTAQEFDAFMVRVLEDE